MLTSERLRELLDYDPETGVFTWRVNRSNVRAGAVAGTARNDGYRQIKIHGVIYLEHRLAWMYVRGRWPADKLDHDNRIRRDSRLTNLRECTHAENHQNLSLRKSNKSGHPGVFWCTPKGRWAARICVNLRRVHIGYFDDIEEAAAAYREAKKQLHPFHPVMR